MTLEDCLRKKFKGKLWYGVFLAGVLVGVLSTILISILSTLFNYYLEKPYHEQVIENQKIMMGVFEVDTIFGTDELKNQYFLKTFNISYVEAKQFLQTLNQNNHFDMGLRSLYYYGDFDLSLYHFNAALLRYPDDSESKLGKAISLGYLNKSKEAKKIFFELENQYSNKKWLYYWIANFFCNEQNYAECEKYSLLSIGEYLHEIKDAPIDRNSITLLTVMCELKKKGMFISENINYDILESGYTGCAIYSTKYNITIETQYLISPN